MMLSRGPGRCSSSRLTRRSIILNLCPSLGGQDDIIHRCREDSYECLSDAKFSYPILNNNCSSRSIYRRVYSTAASASLMTQQKQSNLWNNDHNIYQQQEEDAYAPSLNNITTNIRCMSSSPSISEQITSYLPPTPEVLANATIWGGTGFLLINFHTHLHLPYWAAISLTNICIRSAMLPIAINGAKTTVKFGKISPEVQYVLSNFTSSMKTLKIAGMFSQQGSFKAQQTWRGQMEVMTKSLSTLRALFKLNQVNLIDVFKSPLLQIPFFMYFASDLRRIIEGSNPTLAQELVDSSFFWITDLTEPDPWYGLPIATGALLYLNVETAIGKRSLSGETSSKSNMAMMLKDAFQTLAIFMPCFMAQQPSGVQLYLATSMVFTLIQSNAMRNDTVRKTIGLPSTNAKARSMEEGEYVKDFLSKMAERQAAKAKGGFALGEGVFILGSNISVPKIGRKRKSSIIVEKKEMTVEDMDESQIMKIKLPDHTLQSPLLVFPEMYKTTPVPFIPGLREPEFYTPHKANNEELTMPDISLDVMEAANRGELPERPVEIAPKKILRMADQKRRRGDGAIDKKKLKSKWNKKKGKRGKKRT